MTAALARSRPTLLLGLLCGLATTLSWAAGFVAARHGIGIGLSPADIAAHRFAWGGLFFLPLVARQGFGDLGGVGWGRGIVLTIFGGIPLALLSYAGFVFVPLAHGAVIQPSCAALGGTLLAVLVLKEPLPTTRLIGAAAIIVGLLLLAGEAVTSIGAHGVLGDLCFVAAGSFFAIFAMLLRLWRIAPTDAAAAVCVVGLLYLPVHALLFGFDRLLAAGLWENLLQAVAQGVLSGPLAIFLYTRTVVYLGVGRASIFPALVPVLTLLMGAAALGEIPSLVQCAGLAAVLVGFRYAMKG